MAATLESEAAFRARGRSIGLNDTELDSLRALGWGTFAALSFSCNYTPGAVDDAAFVLMARQVFNIDPPPPDRMPALRRMFYEAFTMTAADLRARLDRTSEDVPRRMAAPEREARFSEQGLRLAGVDLADETEPSHALLDLAVQMHEDNCLKYISWAECTSRTQ